MNPTNINPTPTPQVQRVLMTYSDTETSKLLDVLKAAGVRIPDPTLPANVDRMRREFHWARFDTRQLQRDAGMSMMAWIYRMERPHGALAQAPLWAALGSFLQSSTCARSAAEHGARSVEK